MTDLVREPSDLAANERSASRETYRTLPGLIANGRGGTAFSQFLPSLSGLQAASLSAFVDVAIVFVSFVLAKQIYGWYFAHHFQIVDEYIYAAGLCAVTYSFVSKSTQPSAQALMPRALTEVARCLAISFAIVLVLGFALKVSEMHSRLWMGLAFVIAISLLWTKSQFVHAVISSNRLRVPIVETVALYGARTLFAPLQRALTLESNGLCEVLDYEADGGDADTAAHSGFDRLLQDGLNNKFSRIVLCLPPGQTERAKELFTMLDCFPVRIDVFAMPVGMESLAKDFQISPTRFLVSLDEGVRNEWGLMAKRVFDFVAGAILLVLLSPLMLFAALAVKLEDGGPVFFRQRRHGWNHSVISVWKFRSMRVQQDGGDVPQAVKDDPRVTRIGKFLRRTSIDELPQLFNVLNGEMSLVGPRPHAVAHNVQYSELIASYAVRHKVKPGITGWAQVQGLRGNSEDITAMIKRAEADRWYIRHWSLMLDLRILIETPFVLLKQTNAY